MVKKRTDPLEDYRRKRDPEATPEPFGPSPSEALSESPSGLGAFVVHEHLATRKHYDLRIECGGVLQSFAVPRGPTLDPIEKHLAVRTEPHPIEYLDFEDVIPSGNYGAGPMIVWDRGTVTPLGKPLGAGECFDRMRALLHRIARFRGFGGLRVGPGRAVDRLRLGRARVLVGSDLDDFRGRAAAEQRGGRRGAALQGT